MARRLTKEQIISNVYYDVEEGFGSIQATLKKARQEDPTITKEDVDKFMRNNPTNRLKTIKERILILLHLRGLNTKSI